MRSLFTILLIFFCLGCWKENNHKPIECAFPDIVPFQPYSYPIWHPNGKLIGFNHTSLLAIVPNGADPCIWYSYLGRADSTGFYIMNKDGTGFKRVTNFTISAPAWSPDGNWIAFSLRDNILKMPFNGSNFDTSQIIQLTTSGKNFFPNWTASSDSLYFDSNNNAPAGTDFYSIWKMASNGSGKLRITESAGVGDTRNPFVGADNRIYYEGYASQQPQIFSMNKDGSNRTQITFDSATKRTPRFWQGRLFYEGRGLRSISMVGQNKVFLDSLCATYDISINGEIIYSKMSYDIMRSNRQIGTIWLMNADGSNKRQITFNNF